MSRLIIEREDGTTEELQRLCHEDVLHTEEVILPNSRIKNLRLSGGAGQSMVKLVLNFNNLTSLEFITQLPRLTHLNVQHNQISNLEGVQQTKIRVLKISNNLIHSLKDVTTACPELEELWVANNSFEHPDVVRDLNELKNLDRLVFSPNACCVSSPKLFIAGNLTSLTSVDGQVLTDAIRTEAVKYLAKGFSPASADTEAGSSSSAAATIVKAALSSDRVQHQGNGSIMSKKKTTPSMSENVTAKPESKGIDTTSSMSRSDVPTDTTNSNSGPGASTSPAAEQNTGIVGAPIDVPALKANSGPITQQQVPFPKAKKSGSGLTLRSDGTATLVWPSGKVAVIVDFVAPRSSSKGASGGFSISASHHKSGKLALNFDAAGTGFVNYPPPSSSILLSTNQSGVGTIMDKKYNIVRKWDARSGKVTDAQGSTCDFGLGDEALKLGLSRAASGSHDVLDLVLSKHLGVRISFRPGASELVQVFVKCAGLRVRLERGPNNDHQTAILDASKELFED